ncbi:MAG: serine/threonine protein phosphatase, partial [Burkholderia sp.]|nr:serine/threonine protein phosphatase [Burkholderia sp.]
MSNQDTFPDQPNEPAASVSRRGFLKLAGVSGLATAAGGLAAARAAASTPDGTPEQVHLTWGN